MLRRPTTIGSVILLSLVMLLAACGQKGPLYLPDEHAEQNDDRRDPNQNNAD